MILFAGTDTQHFFPIRANVSSFTTVSRIGPNMQTGLDMYSPGADTVQSPVFAGQTTLWTTFYHYLSFGASNTTQMLWSGNGTELFRLRNGSSGQYMQIWDGGTWTTPGVTNISFFRTGTLTRVDIKIEVADVGSIEIYSDGVLVWSYAGDTLLTAQTTLDQITLDSIKGGSLGSQNNVLSHIFCSDTDSRAIIMEDERVNADGNYTAWTGTFADVDELGDPDASFVTSNVNDDRQSFGFPPLSGAYNGAGWGVVGLGIVASGLRAPTGPQSVNLFCRSGVTDGDGATQGLEITSESRFEFFAQDPATVATWTFAGIDAAEIGVQAKA